jgi:hypothetical protein
MKIHALRVCLGALVVVSTSTLKETQNKDLTIIDSESDSFARVERGYLFIEYLEWNRTSRIFVCIHKFCLRVNDNFMG